MLIKIQNRIDKKYKIFKDKYERLKNYPHLERRNGSLLNYYSNISPEEYLAIKHSSSIGSEFFVSTTRDLSVAFGNFYNSPNIRYVYILKVPRKEVINVHSAVKKKIKVPPFKLTNSKTNVREKELVIPFDATDFVIGIYDIKEKSILINQ